MRKITLLKFVVIFCLNASLVLAREYEQCDLVLDLLKKYSLSLQDSIGMTCVAKFVSELKTTHAETSGKNQIFGMFGIPAGETCEFGKEGYCNLTCDKLLDDDIQDDLECAKKFLKKNKKKPKVYRDCEEIEWHFIMNECKDKIKSKKFKRQVKSELFKLRDFDSNEVDEDIQDDYDASYEEDNRPRPFIKSIRVIDASEESDIPNTSNEEPNYYTDSPPRPFATRMPATKKPKPTKNAKKNSNESEEVTRKRKKKTKKPNTEQRIQPNLISKPPIIKTPFDAKEFRVIPGPSVSVPISSIGQPIPDVPIEPPPSLQGPAGFPPIASNRQYLPPYPSESNTDGRSKKYDIKLERPASQITLHVHYA